MRNTILQRKRVRCNCEIKHRGQLKCGLLCAVAHSVPVFQLLRNTHHIYIHYGGVITSHSKQWDVMYHPNPNLKAGFQHGWVNTYHTQQSMQVCIQSLISVKLCQYVKWVQASQLSRDTEDAKRVERIISYYSAVPHSTTSCYIGQCSNATPLQWDIINWIQKQLNISS